MDDDVNIEEVQTSESPNFWDNLQKKLREWGVAPTSQQEPSEQVEKAPMAGGGMMAPDNQMEDDEEEDEEEMDQPEMMKQQDPLEAPVIKAFLDKQEELHQAQLAAVQKSLDDKYQSVIKGLTEQVENLSKKAQASEQEVERREMIAKAQMYRMFPVETTKLADMLIRLRKADPETYKDWEEMIKAADAQLGASALFGEIGTVRTPEEVETLEAAMAKSKAEGISLKDAMLSLPAYKQQELLNKSRSRAKGMK